MPEVQQNGKMRAVLDPELAGVFAHEAVGHASEGDLIQEGNSVLKGKTGQKIGNDNLTIVDDPGIPEFGFDPVDAEGVAVCRTEIIKKGVINAFLHNRETLSSVGNGTVGHARAMPGEPPLVRMSNTFIEAGDATHDEIFEECRNGIFLKGSRGGQVDPGRGIFQFNAEYGYLIEKGECTKMVRDVSLSGEILKTLHGITLCGNNPHHESGILRERRPERSGQRRGTPIYFCAMRWWVAVAWIDQLLHEAQKTVDEVEVFYVEGTSVSADLKKKKVNLATTSVDCGLGIRTIHKGRIGSSSTNNPDKWEECLNAAIASGKLATLQEWEGLPDPARLSIEPLSFDSSLKLEPDLVVDMIGQMLEGAEQHPAEVTCRFCITIFCNNDPGKQPWYPVYKQAHGSFALSGSDSSDSQPDTSSIIPVSLTRWIQSM